MKQKKMFAAAATMLVAAASFTSCSNQDNAIAPEAPEPIFAFDEGSLIVNGQCEGQNVTNFWVHEWRTMDAQTDGNANILWDEVPASKNHCVVVEVRSEAEAEAAGNATKQDGKFADYDSQFFITFGADQALTEKDQFRLTMKVKADENANVGTQTHNKPGGYMHWACAGNVNFTNEWTEFDSGWQTVASNMAGMYTIAFNLAKGIHNRYFFDDIRIEVKRFDHWVDDNVLTNGRIEEEDMKSFTSVEWINGEKVALASGATGNARRVVDPLDKNNHCVVVTSRDPEGASIDDWDSQFFITVPEALKDGDKYKLEMRVRADKNASANSQSHNGPQNYMHWDAIGTVNFTTEWAPFTKEVTVSGAMVGMNTITINLATFKEANKYYFDDIKVVVEKAPEVTKWKNIMVNGDLEGDDLSGILCRGVDEADGTIKDFATVVEGVGVNKSKAAVINSSATAANPWDTQFFIKLPQKLANGTKYKIKFSVRSDADANIDTQIHTTPGDYNGGGFGNFDSKAADWTVIEKEGSINGTNSTTDTQTIVFNLNQNTTLATKFYFDNIEFYIPE